jgi:hypothetical protein
MSHVSGMKSQHYYRLADDIHDRRVNKIYAKNKDSKTKKEKSKKTTHRKAKRLRTNYVVKPVEKVVYTYTVICLGIK